MFCTFILNKIHVKYMINPWYHKGNEGYDAFLGKTFHYIHFIEPYTPFATALQMAYLLCSDLNLWTWFACRADPEPIVFKQLLKMKSGFFLHDQTSKSVLVQTHRHIILVWVPNIAPWPLKINSMSSSGVLWRSDIKYSYPQSESA